MSALTIKELQPFLQTALAREKLENISIDVLGNTEKGDGYFGDVIFALIQGSVNGTDTKYHVVLKCGKRSKAVRENLPVRDIYRNEIIVYERVIPALNKFALDKKSDLILDCIPRCLGTYSDEQTEIIILENLKERAYTLWNRRLPATLEHLKIVLPQYGKFHALSAALRDQQPEKFEDAVRDLDNVWPKLNDAMKFQAMFSTYIKEAHQMLKDELDENTLTTWLSFENQIEDIFIKQSERRDCFTVIAHGDCWINNLMFQYSTENPDQPIKPALLDWQLACVCHPICDISYLIYASISPNDLNENFDLLLKLYYDSFAKYVKELGSNPEELYSYEQFLEDWKQLGKFGILMCPIIYKLALVESDSAPDITSSLESGLDSSDAFNFKLNDQISQKERLKSLIQHAVQRKFITEKF